MARSATLDAVQILVDPASKETEFRRLAGETATVKDELVCAVERDVNPRELINIPKDEAVRDDELFGLEACASLVVISAQPESLLNRGWFHTGRNEDTALV